MKKAHRLQILFIIALFAVLWLLTSCKPKMMYIPVETVRTEYKDKYLRDSIYRYDSILIKEKGDTVFIEKYKYIYRDKYRTDTIIKIDSISVPYPVEVPGPEVNRPTSFQSFQIWCGRILLLLIIGYFGYRYIKRKIPISR